MKSINPRVILWSALAFLALLNYQAWNQDYGAHPDVITSTMRPSATTNGVAPADQLANQIPEAEKPSTATSKPEVTPAPDETTTQAGAEASLINVRTDVLALQISTRGGTIIRADLLKYPLVKGYATPVRLENEDSAQSLYLLQSGLAGPDPAPNHLAAFTAIQNEYRLDQASELRVPLSWTNDHGVTVTKTYVLRRGDYTIGIEYNIDNHSDTPWAAAPYAQIVRNDPPTKRSMFNVESYAFHGPAMWDGKYRKLNITDKDDSHLAVDARNGWIAALQHHFVTAIVPPVDQPYRFTLSVAGDQYRFAARGPAQSVAPGQAAVWSNTVFIGPKLQSQLKQTSQDLGRVADYGRLYLLAQPLFWLLDKVYHFTGNWGVAIILVTFLLKLVFYPLSEASGRSMAKMKQLAPRIKNLQESYKDDAEKRGRAMMELYQREKVNPVAGCLPMVIQIPVFIAFYWVLLESVEMRQAPFGFWIQDLSSRDPFFVLPGIMLVAMFVQYKLNPAPPDPVQAKVFMVMPLVMSAMFAFFPAGLVLYWVTNTILSILQQWNINRRIAAADAARKS